MTDNKQLKARLLKIKLAAIPATSEARRGLIQDTPVPGSENNQDKLKQNATFIKTKKLIRPPKPTDADFSTFTAKEHGHTILMKGHNRGVFRGASLESQQGHYAKYWLLNAKETNGNGWGIASHSAKANMNKFIGRPLVITSAKWHGASAYGNTYDHPYVPTNDLNKIFEHQEQYRVGNIVDVGEKNGDYYAMIEMLPKFANMTLPPFCSPAIYQLDAKEAEGSISKWEALHLAALDENPAYGARIALLKGTCVGTNNECRVQFRSAKQKEASIVCTKAVKSKLARIRNTRKKSDFTKLLADDHPYKKKKDHPEDMNTRENRAHNTIEYARKYQKETPLSRKEKQNIADSEKRERGQRKQPVRERHAGLKAKLSNLKKKQKVGAKLTGDALKEQQGLDNAFFNKGPEIKTTAVRRNYNKSEKLTPKREERLKSISDKTNLSGVNLNSLRPKKKPSTSDYLKNIRRRGEFRDIFGQQGQDPNDAVNYPSSKLQKKGVVPHFIKDRQTRDLANLRKGTPSKFDSRRSEESLDARTVRNLKRKVGKLKQKVALVRSPDKFKVDREMKHTRVDSNGPMVNKVPFGDEDRDTKTQGMDRIMRDSSYDVKDKKVRPKKPTNKDRARIIKAKLQKLAYNGPQYDVRNKEFDKVEADAVRSKKIPPSRVGERIVKDGVFAQRSPRRKSQFHLKMIGKNPARGIIPKDQGVLNKKREMFPEHRNLTPRYQKTHEVGSNDLGFTNLESEKLAKLKLKIASLGEQNMTYQNSKKVKIRKKKHPEVRKAKSEFNHPNIDAALRGIHSSAMPEKQSTFLSSRGDYIGGGDDHTDTIKSIFNTQYTQEDKGNDGPVTRFSAEHGLPRIQRRILRSGERISVGIHSKINSSQLRSLKDIEKSGIDLGFVVGADPMTGETGDGFRDMTKALRRNRFL